MGSLSNVHPEVASFGPWRPDPSGLFEIPPEAGKPQNSKAIPSVSKTL